jgi:type I restriction enzyme, S subunit
VSNGKSLLSRNAGPVEGAASSAPGSSDAFSNRCHAEPRGGCSGISEKGHAEPRSSRRGDQAPSAPSSALSAPPREKMSGWQTVKLEDVCLFLNGLWKGEKPPFVRVGVIRNTNFTKDGTLDDSDIAYLDVEAKKFEKRRLVYGDIILEKSGGGPKQPVGRVVLFNKEAGDFSFSNFTSALRVRDSAVLDFHYLHRYLHWFYLSGATEEMQSHSTGLRNLDGDAYKAIEVPLPPLSEQRRIVGILDEALAGIAAAKAHAEQNRQHACALFESHLHAVFSNPRWAAKPLGDVCGFQNGFAFKSALFRASGCPILRISNIQDDQVDVDGLVYFDPKDYRENLDRYRVVTGDLMIAMSGGTTGKVGFNTEDDVFYLNQRVGKFEPSEKLNLRFLYFFLSTKVEEHLRISAGSAQPNLSTEQIKGLLLPLPPVSEQQRIVRQLDALSAETRRLEGLYERKAAALDELKQSLLHQAFSGQL